MSLNGSIKDFEIEQILEDQIKSEKSICSPNQLSVKKILYKKSKTTVMQLDLPIQAMNLGKVNLKFK